VEVNAGLRLSVEGQIEGLKVALRSLGGISTLYMLMFSTPVAELCEGMRALKVPELIIELMFLMYRFIFIIYETVSDMITAAKARGNYNIRAFSMICTNLMLMSVKKTNALYDAMVARGYDGRIEFYTCKYRVKARLIVGAVVYIVMMGVILCLS
jgi:cobalt/nickel transport system permease protein